MRPFLWRFWCQTPARGRITIFDRSWYRRVVADRVERGVEGKALQQAFADILAFTHKQWKITAEDWRNREKWDAYKAAVDEMLFRTNTPDAPWAVIESNCKRHARVKVLETIIKALQHRLRKKGGLGARSAGR